MAEKRIVLKNCGVIDPKNIESYIKQEGFEALRKAKTMSPDEVIAEVKASQLKGRGGAGFPCGIKWEIARRQQTDEKYLICNADEGEMGTFKDRYIIQNDPFTLVEGIAIASYAIGVKKAYIYLRAEYHYLLGLLQGAINQAKEKGLLEGLEIEICEGAGAYVCGEESALMNSIEGKRGESRFRPPFPPESGLFAKPTIINNVETLSNIPHIILKGAAWYNGLGTEKSKGTKVFCVSGDVEKPGVYEMEMGSSLRELVEGLAGAKSVKAIQLGGATGRFLPASELDAPLCYEDVLGAGAVVALDESRDIIFALYKTIEFLAEESCGKCAPCREGTEAMLEIFARLIRGEALGDDLDAMNDLCGVMMNSSLCGLGQATPNSVLDGLKYFRGVFENRVQQSLFMRSIR